jgi:integration host factor subunit alpha
MKTVTRADLVAAAYRTSSVSRIECEEIVNEVLEEISAALVAGDIVKIARFGVFAARRPPRDRMGRNPKNGVPAVIKPSTRVTFRAANELKAIVDDGRRK